VNFTEARRLTMPTTVPTSYSIVQRGLHWVTVLFVFFNLLFADAIKEWTEATEKGTVPDADVVSGANLHAYIGIAIIALTLMRIVVRFVQGAPAAPAEEPAIFRLLSKVAHVAFYALLCLMPFLGIGAYYFGNGTAGFLHEGPVKLLLWLLIVVHVAAVLVHQYYWKTNVLTRMTRG
jgi:cytochrome b561